MANPRHQEWITRGAPATTNCEACGASSYEHDIARRRVAGVYTRLCSTCSCELSIHGERGLKAYVRLRGYFGEDVSDEFLARMKR